VNKQVTDSSFLSSILGRAPRGRADCGLKLYQRNQLQCLPGSRGSSAYQPDKEWNALLDAVEKMAEQNKEDSELGPLYAAAANHEREWMERMCRRIPDKEDLLD
jgi:hypothetical protein